MRVKVQEAEVVKAESMQMAIQWGTPTMLVQGEQDEHGNQRDAEEAPILTVYQQDTFVDLCRGPHVAATSELAADAIKLMNVAGVDRLKPNFCSMTKVS